MHHRQVGDDVRDVSALVSPLAGGGVEERIDVRALPRKDLPSIEPDGVAAQVPLADHPRVVPAGLQQARDGLPRAVEPVEHRHAVAVGVLAREDGRPAGRADGIGREDAVEAHAFARQPVRERIARDVKLENGMTIEYSGQYENQLRAQHTLRIIVPTVLAIIFILLFMVYRSAKEAAHVILAVPFALTGGVFLQYLLGYNFSVAVWVGYIALFGTAIETGIVMVVYLEEALQKDLSSLPKPEAVSDFQPIKHLTPQNQDSTLISATQTSVRDEA